MSNNEESESVISPIADKDLEIDPLSDEDLEDIAGGLCSYTVCSTK